MTIIDRGGGPPLVLIPGLQGRWEYVRPAVDALSASFRVVTFPLCDEPSSGAVCDRTKGLDAYADQVEAVLREKRIDRATICGVSFGGVIAVRFAARNPSKTEALLLASTPWPGLPLGARHRVYIRVPWLFGPVFLIESPWRLGPELRAAFPDAHARRRFQRLALRTLVRAPVSAGRMAVRARLLATIDLEPDCSRITAPTLVVIGERSLDRVVPVEGSLEYARSIPHAEHAVIERTGHLGSITRPEMFAERVREFVGRRAGARWPDAAA